MKILSIASAAALLLGASTLALAAAPSDRVLQYQGHDYACTGIGAEARSNETWKRFPLKLEFTNADGDYLGDADVTVTDQRGATVIQAHCLAPWLLADLAPGHYTAEILADGQYRKSVGFDVGGTRQARVVVPFPQVPGT